MLSSDAANKDFLICVLWPFQEYFIEVTEHCYSKRFSHKYKTVETFHKQKGANVRRARNEPTAVTD